MISIAITGGIGSGKTFVSNLLKGHGIPIYNSDDEAKRLMVSDEGIRRDLIDLLGEEVYLHRLIYKIIGIQKGYYYLRKNKHRRCDRL